MKCGNITGQFDGLYQVAYDNVLTSATDTITITSLDGDTDEEYILLFYGIDKNTIGTVQLQFNGDTSSNYGYTRFRATGLQSERVENQSYIRTGLANSNGYITFDCSKIYAKSGNERLTLTHSAIHLKPTGKIPYSNKFVAGIWNNINDNLTSITVKTTEDQFDTGTRVTLLKKVNLSKMKLGSLDPQGDIENAWQKIYEITLTENADNISITGLDGDTDIYYRVIIRGKTTGNLNWFGLRLNNDSGNNYGIRGFRLKGAGVQTTYNTSSYIRLQDAYGNNYKMLSDILLYAPKGKSRIGFQIGGVHSSGYMRSYIHPFAWDNQNDNLTSIQLLMDTGQLSSGTQIVLYKLNV